MMVLLWLLLWPPLAWSSVQSSAKHFVSQEDADEAMFDHWRAASAVPHPTPSRTRRNTEHHNKYVYQMPEGGK
jgi:hypothetical protein